jgi:hypothetical protein
MRYGGRRVRPFVRSDEVNPKEFAQAESCYESVVSFRKEFKNNDLRDNKLSFLLLLFQLWPRGRPKNIGAVQASHLNTH